MFYLNSPRSWQEENVNKAVLAGTSLDKWPMAEGGRNVGGNYRNSLQEFYTFLLTFTVEMKHLLKGHLCAYFKIFVRHLKLKVKYILLHISLWVVRVKRARCQVPGKPMLSGGWSALSTIVRNNTYQTWCQASAEHPFFSCWWGSVWETKETLLFVCLHITISASSTNNLVTWIVKRYSFCSHTQY